MPKQSYPSLPQNCLFFCPKMRPFFASPLFSLQTSITRAREKQVQTLPEKEKNKCWEYQV